ncbi:hypothetical protein [Stieleria varia]|uniref:Uncharacterized protein n=1 Tax=Stieleria varia TaxID=2528005 RepID=A0A5C6B4I3_9BACT|nr:hypothetical protein [Stieleria varia]TWU06472.1 hypothetical protein Pla52n_21930 [Stieleria varia]
MSDEPNGSNESNDPNESNGATPKLAPTLRLSRFGLVVALAGMVATGLLVYAIFPSSVGGPPLPVAVRLEKQPVQTTAGDRALLTEVIAVQNIADHELKKIAIEINGQYLMFNEAPLVAGDSLVLPLRVFTDKRSSQRYDPIRYPVEEVIVRGQLPSNARGVSEFSFAAEEPE